jgi:hypothetical protein
LQCTGIFKELVWRNSLTKSMAILMHNVRGGSPGSQSHQQYRYVLNYHERDGLAQCEFPGQIPQQALNEPRMGQQRKW